MPNNTDRIETVTIATPEEYKEAEKKLAKIAQKLKEINDFLSSSKEEGDKIPLNAILNTNSKPDDNAPDIDIFTVISLKEEAKDLAVAMKSFLSKTFLNENK